jgi:glycosyltransferase involved in cell wall biosynthesis
MNIVRDKSTFTCVIPFYNESLESVIRNIQEVLEVSEIDHIVVIDDGSDSVVNYEILKALIYRKEVTIDRLDVNSGKTSAIYHALKYVRSGSVFLCDSDLKYLNSEEISDAMQKYDLLGLRMLVLRRINIGFFPKIIRADTLLSGERILGKNDLINIIESGVKGYQLEVATNQYFLKHNLQEKCFWSKSSAVNNYKYIKLKFLKGIFKDIKMYFNIIKFVGINNYTKQFLTFCKKNA